MRIRRVWQLVVLCVVLATLSLLSGVNPFASRAEPAFARNDREESPLPTPEVEEEIEPYIQMYAEAFGISYAEAKWRLALQGEMSDLQRRVIEGEPADIYAGTWTQHQPEFRLVFAFTVANGAEIIQPYLDGIEWADLVLVQQSPYTVDELLAIQAQVIQAAETTGIPFGAGSNIPLSRVNLYTLQPEELRRQLETKEEIQEYLDMIDYIEEGPAAPASSLHEIYLPRIVIGGEE